MGQVTAPELLNQGHDARAFSCGNPTLDEWLSKRALKNQDSGASRIFVICKDKRVVGYYALATGSVERDLAPSQFSRNMPNPIPVIVLGRLAVDVQHQGQRLGAALLKDAILRTLNVAESVGVRGLMVHAISESAKQFYLTYGFQETTFSSMTLLLPLKQFKQL